MRTFLLLLGIEAGAGEGGCLFHCSMEAITFMCVLYDIKDLGEGGEGGRGRVDCAF